MERLVRRAFKRLDISGAKQSGRERGAGRLLPSSGTV